LDKHYRHWGEEAWLDFGLDEEAVLNFLQNPDITKFDVLSSAGAHGILIVYCYRDYELAEEN
jgi:hypothetical protein